MAAVKDGKKYLDAAGVVACEPGIDGSRRSVERTIPWDEEGEYFARVVIKSDGVKFIRGAKTLYRVTGPQSYGHVDHPTINWNLRGDPRACTSNTFARSRTARAPGALA